MATSSAAGALLEGAPAVRVIGRMNMDRAKIRCLMAMGALAVVCSAFASPELGTIRLTVYPDAAVADGRSTLTVTAEVRDNSGQVVPDGTQVVFDTNLGLFRESVVSTQNGFAQAILVASSLPGEAKVRASVLKFGAVSTVDVRFVSDRSILDNSKEYIEVVAPRAMAYSLEDKILEASGEDRGVHLRYGDITIEADDLQLIVPNYEVRGKNALVRIGDVQWEFESVYMRLNQRKGVGVMKFQQPLYRLERAWFVAYPIGTVTDRYKTVNIEGLSITESSNVVPSAQFEFQDISMALTIIEAKKAVCFPSKEVHFHRSNVIVGGQSVMRLPLFRASTQPSSPVITEQFINVTNNDIAVNYPYYVDLRPGSMSLFRLRQGSQYGSGAGVSGGTFLDYEWSWNEGASMDGGLSVRGLGRNDWGVNLRQFWKPSLSSTISSQLDFPAHKSMFANLNASQNFVGFHTTANLSHGQSIEGDRFRSNQYSLIVEKDPVRMGSVPARLYVGAVGSQTSFNSATSTHESEQYGIRARLIGDPLRLGAGQSLRMSYSASKYVGGTNRVGLAQQGTLSLTTSFRNGVYLQTNYDYIVDGITDVALGRHRLTADAYYNRGSFGLRGYASKSLDVQHSNVSLALDYKSSSLWRFSYALHADQYLGQSLLDQTAIVAYRLGFREIGLSYSYRRQRLGIEILGTTFN